MSIGSKIKDTVDFNNMFLKSIHESFETALTEANENGVEVHNKSTYGHNLSATIDRYTLDIPINDVIRELKVNNIKIQNAATKQQIESTVNEIVLKYLSY